MTFEEFEKSVSKLNLAIVDDDTSEFILIANAKGETVVEVEREGGWLISGHDAYNELEAGTRVELFNCSVNFLKTPKDERKLPLKDDK